MTPPDDIATRADVYYPHTGPDADGQSGWYLWKGHMFRFERERYDSYTGDGQPVADWLRRWRDSGETSVQAIVADLAKRGL